MFFFSENLNRSSIAGTICSGMTTQATYRLTLIGAIAMIVVSLLNITQLIELDHRIDAMHQEAE